MAGEIYSFRLEPDLIARIDALHGNRSKFIRTAVDAALGSPAAVDKPSGWICPSCSTIWAPSVQSCSCNSPYVPVGEMQ